MVTITTPVASAEHDVRLIQRKNAPPAEQFLTGLKQVLYEWTAPLAGLPSTWTDDAEEQDRWQESMPDRPPSAKQGPLYAVGEGTDLQVECDALGFCVSSPGGSSCTLRTLPELCEHLARQLSRGPSVAAPSVDVDF